MAESPAVDLRGSYQYAVRERSTDKDVTNVLIKQNKTPRRSKKRKSRSPYRSGHYEFKRSPSPELHKLPKVHTMTQKSPRDRKARRLNVNGLSKVVLKGKQYTVYRPHDDPAFFNIFVEKKHADHLARKDLDDESRLHVIYHVLKEQLRIAKSELLTMKKNRDKDLKRAIAFKRELKAAASKAHAKEIEMDAEMSQFDLA